MGVCSIQSHPLRQFIFCSGSYDESVLVWDHRQLRQPLREIRTGGGVWRVKWHPHEDNMLLTACMHDGWKILDIDAPDDGDAVVASYHSPHSSLAYGVDWCLWPDTMDDPAYHICSCSFYDHLMSCWTCERISSS